MDLLGTLRLMSRTTVSSKGQITLPAAMLRERHLTPGTQLEVVATSNAIVLITTDEPLARRLAGSTRGIYGDAAQYVDQVRDEWASPS
jgi:AbrB family looped-hinge helix DNA binding protein